MKKWNCPRKNGMTRKPVVLNVKMISEKGCGRKCSWLNLKYCPSSCLERQRKTAENLSG
jgi:hypothetical protein